MGWPSVALSLVRELGNMNGKWRPRNKKKKRKAKKMKIVPLNYIIETIRVPKIDAVSLSIFG